MMSSNGWAAGDRALPRLRFGGRDCLGAAEVAIDLVGLRR